MLEYAARQVAGDSRVENVGSLVIRHYVDVEVFWLSHRVSGAACESLHPAYAAFRMMSSGVGYLRETLASVMSGHRHVPLVVIPAWSLVLRARSFET